ncbi:MAG TPA: DUF2461 family protein [Candidatus Dormibacteraeota bacterium]|nr:DUF2461 family protein [Candidatus Dormibacteraeota bacterium]
MNSAKPIFTQEALRFFKDLARNNRKDWMDANRERYQTAVVQPFRRLLEELSPAVLRLDHRFDTSSRHGASFSRINRDIRFAKDKTPYRPQMYLKFSAPFAGEGETGELYVGLSANTATVGFRIYAGSKRKDSALGQIAEPRVQADPRWPAKQKARLSRKYESYWYHVEKGQWSERRGWPISAEEWKKLHAWIVRRKLKPTAATSATFTVDIAKVFRDLYPLLKFTSLA